MLSIILFIVIISFFVMHGRIMYYSYLIIAGLCGIIYMIKNKDYSWKLLALILAVIFMIPSTVSQIKIEIDDSKKDTFSGVALSYVKNIQSAASTDKIECTNKATEKAGTNFEKISQIPTGDLYIFIATSDSIMTSIDTSFDRKIARRANQQIAYLKDPVLKSPWNNEELYGWVHITKAEWQTNYYIALADAAKHGINQETGVSSLSKSHVEIENVKVDISKVISAINNDTSIDGSEIEGIVYYCHLTD